MEDARNDHGRNIAAVHLGALVANHFLVERRRVAVEVPALHPEAALQFLDDRGLGDECIFLGAAQGPGVHERQVRKITQVVDDQQIVCVVMQIGGNALPIRILQVGQVDDQGRIRLGRIAHPNPNEVAAFDDGVAAHLESRRNHVLAGNLHALSGAVVLDAVIHAAYSVAFEPALGEQRAAMRAAVVERDDLAAFTAIQQHVFAEQGAPQ